MIRISKSQITNKAQFDNTIAEYRKHRSDWENHQRRVESDFLNDKIEEKNKARAYPAPTCDPLVLQALDGYELYDDTTPLEELLLQKKQALSKRLLDAQLQANAGVRSNAKLQLDIQRQHTIFDGDQTRASDILSKRMKLVSRLKSILKPEAMSPLQEAMEGRSPSDTAFLKEHDGRVERLKEIHQRALEAQAEIEDLTVATVDAYKLPTL